MDPAFLPKFIRINIILIKIFPPLEETGKTDYIFGFVKFKNPAGEYG